MDHKSSEKKTKIKLLLLGDQAVGKSSLLMRYVENEFKLSIMGTAGMDVKKKIVKFGENEITVIIYDTAGQDRFRNIAKSQYKGSSGIFIIYDITDKKSFLSVANWIDSIKEHADEDVEILLVGNKIDMNEERKVTTDEGLELANKYSVAFIETSAKTAENVDNAFMTLITNAYKKIRDSGNKTITVNTNSGIRKEKKKNKCC